MSVIYVIDIRHSSLSLCNSPRLRARLHDRRSVRPPTASTRGVNGSFTAMETKCSCRPRAPPGDVFVCYGTLSPPQAGYRPFHLCIPNPHFQSFHCGRAASRDTRSSPPRAISPSLAWAGRRRCSIYLTQSTPRERLNPPCAVSLSRPALCISVSLASQVRVRRQSWALVHGERE